MVSSQLISSVSCELVTAFKSISGKLEITNQNVYFIANYDMSTGRVDSLSRKWPIHSLEKLMKRRLIPRWICNEELFDSSTITDIC